MNALYLVLLLLAAVFFVLAAYGVAFTSRRGTVNFVALGLLCWVLVPLIQTFKVL